MARCGSFGRALPSHARYGAAMWHRAGQRRSGKEGIGKITAELNNFSGSGNVNTPVSRPVKCKPPSRITFVVVARAPSSKGVLFFERDASSYRFRTNSRMRQWPAKGLHLNKQILASIARMQKCHESHHSKLIQRDSDHDEMVPKI